MTENFVVNAESRADQGKGASRRLRRAGKVPAVLYGAGEPVSLTLDHNEMIHHIENEAFFSHILELNIDGKAEKAIIRDLQRHPAKNMLIHADFQRVDAKQELHVNVPLHFINEEACAGVKTGGGVLHHLATEIDIACLPKDLPEFIEVDVIDLAAGETLHLSQIKLPKGVRSVVLAQGEDHDAGVIACHKGHGTTEAAEAGEETAEGGEE